MPSNGVCLSVRLSVTFVDSVETNKHKRVFKFNISPKPTQQHLIVRSGKSEA